MDKDYEVMHALAQARARQGWVTPGEEGCQGEKNSSVKDMGIQGLMTSWVGRKRYLCC